MGEHVLATAALTPVLGTHRSGKCPIVGQRPRQDMIRAAA